MNANVKIICTHEVVDNDRWEHFVNLISWAQNGDTKLFQGFCQECQFGGCVCVSTDFLFNSKSVKVWVCAREFETVTPHLAGGCQNPCYIQYMYFKNKRST